MNGREGVLNEKARVAAGQEALAEALPPLTRHEALVDPRLPDAYRHTEIHQEN
jgi:hypothetical protein